MWFQKYIDQVEAHLPFKPSKWERKYKILLLCLVGIFFVAAIVVFALHDQIVRELTPYAEAIAEYHGSWLVPIVLLIVVSFPPLFGHEMIAVLTGIVWPLSIAFILVCVGSIAGESLLFLSFRNFLHDRIVEFRKKHEHSYGTMVMVITQHKRWMIFLIRLSAIPGHFSTPLFSSIDEIEYKEWLYMVLATSWKFAIPVYIGHLVANQQTSWVGTFLVIFSTCITIGVAAYLYREFRTFKSRHDRLNPIPSDLEQGETEFEIAPTVVERNGFGKINEAERSPLVRSPLAPRPSDEDDFFSDEERV